MRVTIETPPVPPSEVVIRMSQADAEILTEIMWWIGGIPDLIAQGEKRLMMRAFMTRLRDALRAQGIH